MRARRRAARDPVAGDDRHRARGLGQLRQRGLAGALPVGRRRRSCTRCTTARAPTWRPSSRSRRCSGVTREPLRAGAARGRAGRADRAADRGSAAAPTPARTRRAACGRSSRARARCASTARVSRSTSRAASPGRRTRATRVGELRSRPARA